jgi:hypothetical protein
MNLTNLCDRLRLINNEIEKLEEFSCKDPYHNHLYKELFIAECILNYDKSFYSFAANNKVSPDGHDFKNKLTNNGECKSSAAATFEKRKDSKRKIVIGHCRFEFDKQNDVERRKNLLSVKSYAFGYFKKRNLLFVQYITGKAGIKWMNDRIKKKQWQKMKIIANCVKKKVQLPRDSIRFDGNELINCPDSVFLDDKGNVIENIQDILYTKKNA